MTITTRIIGFMGSISLCAMAWAGPQVSINIDAAKEIVVYENGSLNTKKVPADTIEPGETLVYTLTYTNQGDESAKNVVLDNPVPEDTTYVAGSAAGNNTDVLFSIDNGKTYSVPSQLNYTVSLPSGKEEKRSVSPDRYTNIRWVMNNPIAPGTEGQVIYKVLVK